MKKLLLSLFCLLTVSYMYAAEFKITVPEGATLYVGSKAGKKHFQPFTEKLPVGEPVIADGKSVYTFDITGQHNYRVSKAGSLTYTGILSAADGGAFEITAEMMEGDPKAIDHDVTNNSGRNMADIFLNINAQGYLKLNTDDTYQLINLRNWEAIDSDVGNYFIEPDYNYFVVNENGEADNSVVTVSESGLLTAAGAGTAIVLVTYDAFICSSANVGPFFSALWPENTGVFVVTVDGADSGISTGMKINENWNTLETNKLSTVWVDAELDVFYYLEETGGYEYTFTPADVQSVELAQPVLGENIVSYNGFSSKDVINNGDGSYTIKLVHGRNIVKLSSATGVEYQVLSAKPVTYTIKNNTNEGAPFQAGDEVSILFNTLYHPCNKLSGVYNMSAGIQYTGAGTDFGPILGAGQYTFASKAQEFKVTIPADFSEDNFELTGGVIKVRGYGDHYGNHRAITLENGKGANMNAEIRLAYFGALPSIYIRLVENPTDPANIKSTPSKRTVSLSWDAAIDNENVAGYNVYVDDDLVEFVAVPQYLLEGLEPGTEYTVEVEAVDNKDNRSGKTSVKVSTIAEGAPGLPTDLASTAKTETTIDLTWEAPEGDVVVTGYKLYVDGELKKDDITTTTYQMTGLKAGTMYSVQLEAYNAAGEASGKTQAVVIKTSDNTIPTTPGNLAGVQTVSTIELTWTASTDNVGVTGYNLYVNNEFVELLLNETSYYLRNLTPDTEYFVEVEAIDEAGNKSVKATLTIKTLKPETDIPTITDDKFEVYPNPFVDYIVVNADSHAELFVYDYSGQVVMAVQLQSGKNKVNTAALPNGIYIVKCGDRKAKIVK